MSNNNVTPEMMSMLDTELKDIQSKKRGFRTVRIDENDSWLIRYLPFEFGNGSKPFFLKVANHWIMKRPYFCPRNSSPEVGGHPDAPCAVCDNLESMLESSDQAIRKAAFKSSATQQWLMYCFVFEKELAKNRGEIEVITDPEERWTPWEYWHSKWGFEEFIGIFRKCASRAQNSVNVLDLMHGCNFWAASTAKGISLRREDAGPVADATPEEIQGIIDFAWSKIKVPTYTPLNDEQVDAALIKLEESSRDIRDKGPKTRTSSTNFRERSDDGDLAPQAPRRPVLPATPQRPSAPQVPVTPSTPQARQAPAAPQVRPAPPSAPQARQAPSVRLPATQPAQEERATTPPRVAPPSVAVPRNAAPRAAVATVKPVTTESTDGSEQLQPQAPRQNFTDRLRTRTQTPRTAQQEELPGPSKGAPGSSTIDNDADNVTEENIDHAPPGEVSVDDAPPDVTAQGEVQDSDGGNESGEESAPPIPTVAISDRLRAGIRTASTRNK